MMITNLTANGTTELNAEVIVPRKSENVDATLVTKLQKEVKIKKDYGIAKTWLIMNIEGRIFDLSYVINGINIHPCSKEHKDALKKLVNDLMEHYKILDTEVNNNIVLDIVKKKCSRMKDIYWYN